MMPMDSVYDRFAAVLTSIGWPSRNLSDPIEGIGFTSCSAGHGVSTIAMQVAIAAATKFDVRTLLVDCDQVGGALHDRFNVSDKPGLAELIRTGDEAHHYYQNTQFTNLKVLASGGGNAVDDLNRASLRNCFRTILSDHDIVILRHPRFGFKASTRVVLVVDGSCGCRGGSIASDSDAARVPAKNAGTTWDLDFRCCDEPHEGQVKANFAALGQRLLCMYF